MWLEGKFSYGMVISPTARSTGNYDFVPQRYVHSMFKEELITNLIAGQNGLMQRGYKNVHAFLILDDCLGSVNWNSNTMKKLCSCYRNYNISVFIAVQYPRSIPALMRDCVSHAFIFNVSTNLSIKAIRDVFMGEKKEEEVRELIEKHCKDHHFIVVKMQQDIQNKYLISKAPPSIPKVDMKF